MGVTFAYKITKEPRTFQAGESTGFNLSLGRQYYDRKAGEKKWANYKAVVFGKGGQLAFYQQALVPGTIIELTADEQKIDDYNPDYLSIELLQARVTGIFTQQGAAPQQRPQQPARAAQQAAQPQQQSGYQQAAQQQAPGGYDAFDDDIPFAPYHARAALMV